LILFFLLKYFLDHIPHSGFPGSKGMVTCMTSA
jgi:hypothetical protein